MAKLTARRQRFVREYLVDLNATQAAIRAGYSAKTANEQAARLLANVSVQEAVQKAMTSRSRRTEITQDHVLRELAAVAFARGTNYAQVADGSVRITPTAELTDDQKAAVVSIKETQNGIEIRIADKLKALDLLGRHLGMFSGRGGQDVEDMGAVRGEVFSGNEDEDT